MKINTDLIESIKIYESKVKEYVYVPDRPYLLFGLFKIGIRPRHYIIEGRMVPPEELDWTINAHREIEEGIIVPEHSLIVIMPSRRLHLVSTDLDTLKQIRDEIVTDGGWYDWPV